MAKSKARYLADVLQGDGSLVFSGDLSVPTTFTIDPLPSGAGGSVTIGGDLVSTGGLGNASLENSSITINSYNTSLGGTVTLVTDDVLEGGSPTNLYYTDARSRASISLTDTGGDGSLTYDSGTGAFTFTGPSAAETRAHFTAGTGVSITTGEIAIGQPVATTDAVTFSSVTGTGSSSFDTLTVTTTATVPYDNTISGLTATNVQSAITELNTLLGGGNIGSQATWNVYEFTTAGNDTSFDISTQGSPSPSYVPGYVKVYLNGLLLSESDYTAVDGTTVNFSPAITNAGQLVSVVVLDSFNTAELLRVTSIDASAATNTLTIDSSSNVGIGTGSPAAKLHIENGDMRIEKDTKATIGFRGHTTGSTALAFRDSNAGIDRMTIDASGLVSITNTAPTLRVENTDTSLTTNQTIGDIDFYQNDTSGEGVGVVSKIRSINDSGFQGEASLAFHTGNTSSLTERLRINSSGNVGIGTDAPTKRLHVHSGISSDIVVFENDSGSVVIGKTPNLGSLDMASDANFRIRHGSVVSATFSSNGNVGIGTTNPGARLQVQTAHTSTDVTAANLNSTLNVANSGAGNGVYNAIKFAANQQDMYIMSFNNNQQADRRLGFFLGSVAGDAATDERLSITGNGNVGIGTTAPTSTLDISHQITTDGVEYPLLIAGKDVGNAVNQLTSSGIGLQFKLAGNNSAGDSLTGASIAAMRESASDADSSTGLAFLVSQNDTTLDEAVRIDHDGNVGIGTNSPAVPLHVYNATQGRVAIENASRRFDLSVDADGLGFRDQTAAVTRMILTSAGNVGIGTTNPAATLDVKRDTNTVNNLDSLGFDVAGIIGNAGSNPGNHYSSGIRIFQGSGSVGSGLGVFNIGVDNGTAITANQYTAHLIAPSGMTGGISLSTGGAARMRIDANGNVGIGTTTPDNILDLGSATQGRALTWSGYANAWGEYSGGGLHLASNYYGDTTTNTYLTSTTANFGAAGIRISGTSGSNNGGEISFYVNPETSKTAGAAFTPLERMVITKDGNVGIGTNNPVGNLHIVGGDGLNGSSTIGSSSNEFIIENNSNAGLTIRSGADGRGVISFADPDDHNIGQIYYSHDTDKMLIVTNDAVRMTVDSSGNLLVGTTSLAVSSSTGSVTGAVINTTGLFEAAKTGTVMDLNRLSADGTILNFRFNGQVIGSIGVTTGPVAYIVLNDAASDNVAALKGASGAILPSTNAGADKDGTMNLGSSGARFNDLHLAGGVVFGTTGGDVTSKTLEDYEEGTFTPTISSLTNLTGTAAISHARYTKVGRIVHCSIAITGLSVTASGTDTSFTFTIPFPAFQGAVHGVSGTVNFNSITSNGAVNDSTGANNTTFAASLPAEVCGGSGAVAIIALGFTYEAA